MDSTYTCRCGSEVDTALPLELLMFEKGLGCFACNYGGRIPALPKMGEQKTVQIKLPQGSFIVIGIVDGRGQYATWRAELYHNATKIHVSCDPDDRCRMYLHLKALLLGADPDRLYAWLIEHDVINPLYRKMRGDRGY